MDEIRTYQDLRAWQTGRAMVKAIYEATVAFPREERFGLTAQVRRAAVSIPSNVAEGYGRGTRKDYVHFLQTARGSLYEMETQVILADDLGFFMTADTPRMLLVQSGECSRILNGLIRSLEADRNA